MSGRSGSENRRIVNGPPTATCGPKEIGSTWILTLGSADIVIRCWSCARIDGPWPSRHSAASSTTSLRLDEDLLARHPQCQSAFNIAGGFFWVAELDYLIRNLTGLQQVRDELRL